jgi:hypothetical protein
LHIPPNVPVIGTGDVLVSRGRELMNQYPWLSGVLLDFTSNAIETFLNRGQPYCLPALDGAIPNCLS